MTAAVDAYVALRRVAGFALSNTEYLLHSFGGDEELGVLSRMSKVLVGVCLYSAGVTVGLGVREKGARFLRPDARWR